MLSQIKKKKNRCSEFDSEAVSPKREVYTTRLSFIWVVIKIVIVSSEKLTDSDLEEIVDEWDRKGSWIAV